MSNENGKMRDSTNQSSGRIPGAESLAALLGERAINLRQTILRAHRGMNRLIERKFRKRGYQDIRVEHLSVLANMNLGETDVHELAERAQITLIGVRDLLSDLVRLGYVYLGDGETSVDFSDAGWELMLTSFNIQKELEADFNAMLQVGDVEQLRRILGTMFDEEKSATS